MSQKTSSSDPCSTNISCTGSAADRTRSATSVAIDLPRFGETLSFVMPSTVPIASTVLTAAIFAIRRRTDSASLCGAVICGKRRRKVETIRVGVGYPDTWTEYSELELAPDTAYANKQAAEQL